MAQHRCGQHDGTGAVRDGAPNGLVGDGCPQLGGTGIKQLIASNNLPVAESCHTDGSNEDQYERDDVGAEA